MPRTQIVLPARLASTRLPEKLLQRVAGKSVIQHTYEAASRAQCASEGVIVAVDHQRIADEVESFGGRWLMTPPDCPSGTDRVAFVARQFPQIDVFVNVQSDEPEIDPAAIDAVAAALADDETADMATAGTPIKDPDALADPSIVKIVMAGFSPGIAPPGTVSDNVSDVPASAVQTEAETGQGRAIYFSRACVPFDRDGDPKTRLFANPAVYWHHLGLYAYRNRFLSWFAGSPPSILEQIEKLEQLRAIEAGK